MTSLKVAALAAVSIGMFASAASAAPVVDQQNTAPYYFNYAMGSAWQFKQTAQIFTAGVDGSLVGIAMQLARAGTDPATGSLTVSIVSTFAGQAHGVTGWFDAEIPAPTGESWGGQIGQTLASFTIDAADLPVVQFQYGNVAPMTDMFALPVPIDIEAGEQYAILLEYTGPGLVGWNYNYQWPDPDSYAGGRAFYRVGAGYGWVSPEEDMAFQTFVEGPQQVPEPGTLALLAGGIVMLGLAMRRRIGA